MSDALPVRFAAPPDLPRLHALIERAYRGDSARLGWTHEADLVFGQRTDLAALSAVVADPRERILVAEDGGEIVGCVQISDRGGGTAYLGLLCVEPARQAGGLGRRLISEGERLAAAVFDAARLEMTVIDRRSELIGYYQRRGYVLTSERRPFPVAVTPPLEMVVLEKRLG